MESEFQIAEENASQSAGISAELALQQIANLCKHINGFEVEMSRNGLSFATVEKDDAEKRGILSISGELTGDSIVSLKTEILRASENTRISS